MKNEHRTRIDEYYVGTTCCTSSVKRPMYTIIEYVCFGDVWLPFRLTYHHPRGTIHVTCCTCVITCTMGTYIIGKCCIGVSSRKQVTLKHQHFPYCNYATGVWLLTTASRASSRVTAVANVCTYICTSVPKVTTKISIHELETGSTAESLIVCNRYAYGTLRISLTTHRSRDNCLAIHTCLHHNMISRYVSSHDLSRQMYDDCMWKV